MREPEPRDRDRRPGPTAGEPRRDVDCSGRRRVFPCDDNQVRALERLPALAPGTRRQWPGRSRPALNADHRDVQVARHAQQLVRVVQYEHAGSRGPRRRRARYAVGVRHDDRLGDEPAVDQRLVAPVSAQ